MRHQRKIWIYAILTALLCVVLFSGCAQSTGKQNSADIGATTGDTSYPVTIADGAGGEVTITQEPTRVVSLSPANTEIVFALGAGAKLVGRTAYDNYPAEAAQVPSIGEFASPNVEKIIAASPDLVLASDFINDDIKKQIEASGAKVLLFSPNDITGIEKTIVDIGKVLNTNDKAKEVTTDMTTQYNNIVATAKKASTQKSVFIDLGSYYTAGPDSLLNSMLVDLNAKNIAGDAESAWPQLSAEKIISANPDVYISLYTKEADLKKVAGFDKLNAFKNNAVYVYGPLSEQADLMQRSGPRIVDGLALMAKDIYPDLFK